MSINGIPRLGVCAFFVFFASQANAIPGPPPPPEVDITGVWSIAGTGSIDDDKGTSCTYVGNIDFQQTGGQITGQASVPLVAGDATCPSMTGPISGTVGGITANFLIGGPVKDALSGVEFCGDVHGKAMAGLWQSPGPLPCFELKDAKGLVFRGEFTSERTPAQAPTLSVPAVWLLIVLVAGLGIWVSRRGQPGKA